MEEKNNSLEENVDVAIHKARKLQEEIFNFKNTPNDIFKFTTEIIKSMEAVSKEVRKNNSENNQ